MWTAVSIVNIAIALFGFYVAWNVWQIGRVLARVADLLLEVERSTDRVLQGAPPPILTGQVGTRQLRYRYQLLVCYLARLHQILALLNWGKRAWQRRGGRQIASRRRLAVRRRSIE
ncbi:MAG TPA: hypothetical protein IGS17_18900 [Oscillatoriales cyanobacterium M59_W2019_021]|nr:hypothetical protein [Oscillatoriales cyanobacterium M4454_W2019_049]HIK52966.1 hypothetical protein [Oscillatoriales cyanobacterium M59_W2019_021]